MVSDRVLRLCQAQETLSSVLAANPSEAPGDIVKRLYYSGQGNNGYDNGNGDGNGNGRDNANHNADGNGKDTGNVHNANGKPNGPDPLETTALECGNWGPTTPSPLFLQAYADALACLDGGDPLCGVVSPPLMGSHGTIPLTAVAPLADVMRHCANLIARAEREVVLVTCAWSPSLAQRLVRDALVELSRRAGRGGRRVVVKIMYDRAAPTNALDPHQEIKPAAYAATGVQLPAPEEIPHVDLQVVSLHRFFLGTLHAKFCVVDRKMALVMSNNVEDNDNMEMMVHLEGPIVDSIYDSALMIWSKPLDPPLPCLLAAAQSPTRTAEQQQDETEGPADEPLYLARGPSRVTQEDIVAEAETAAPLAEHTPEDPHYDDDLAGEIRRMQSCYAAKPDETRLQAANRLLNLAVKNPIPPTGPEIADGEEMTPYLATSTPQPVPMALVSRPAYGPFDSKSVRVPQNEAWLSLIRHARRSIFIQTPDLNAAPLLQALAGALRRGVEVTYYVCFGYNDLGEMIPGQGGTNDQAAQALVASLPPDGPERARLRIHDYVGKDQARPVHHSFKARSCHVKLLIADGAVAVQGSGNQDTQSWFHSLEVNIMVDGADVCARWREGLERNQNTARFGRVAADGIWRDASGNPADGYQGDPGRVSGLVRGVTGMALKAKGMGGF
ncbi:phospholipase D Active site motif protein [Purpureocillium lavendulum]|uniref:Phospholipase D Active site motif protein n=1 Tax=Purpureocillium lavendulum TaxID=1247861 RepID=A0AB34G205_9HYPO|nr:phospholipase D Active site motif protein [Purpureocillium lavendulum]